MPVQPPRSLSGLARMLAAAGVLLALAGCGGVTPLGPDAAPPSFPPSRDLGSPIIMQLMRGQSPTPAGRCPAGSITLFGSDPSVPRAAVAPPVRSPEPGQTATTPPAPVAPSGEPTGVACFVPVGAAVRVAAASVSSVTAEQKQQGPDWYVFAIAFPAAQVPALTTLIRHAYSAGDALGMSVDGKLWQAPVPRTRFVALRAEQINLLSKTQAFRLYRLLVPAG